MITAKLLLISSLPQSFDSVTPTLRTGNLSALKQRWEQAGHLQQDKASSALPLSQPSSRFTPSAQPRPAPLSEHCPPSKSPRQLTPQGGRGTASCFQYPSTASKAPEGEEKTEMERDELKFGDGPEKLEEQVVLSPSAFIEKPSVPLSNLKMRFEKGEDATHKVSLAILCTICCHHASVYVRVCLRADVAFFSH